MNRCDVSIRHRPLRMRLPALVMATAMLLASVVAEVPARADSQAGGNASVVTPDGASSLSVPSDRDVRGLWTATSRTWAIGEGTYQTQLFTSPVNYQDSKGRWQEIDTTLVPSSATGFAWENKAGPIRVLFPATLAKGGVRVEQGSTWVQFIPKGAAGTATVSGSTVTYANAYPGVTFSYQAVGNGVKESLILAGPTAQSSFTFDVRRSSGVTVQASTAGGLDVVDSTGEARFHVAAPFMQDSSPTDADVSNAVTMFLSTSGATPSVTMTASSTWLDASDRVWPVVVDPSVSLSTTSGRDCYINQASPTTPYCADTRVKVGRNAGNLRRGLLYWDPSGIPGTVVSDAQIDLWCDKDASPPPAIEVQVRRATVDRTDPATSWKPWNDTASWNKRAGTTAWMAGTGGDFGSFVYALRSISCSAASGYKVWSTGSNGHTVSELVQKWVDGGGFENDGVVIKTSTADESTASLLNFYSAETAHPPVLEVTSTRPSGLEGGGFQDAIAVNPTDPNIVVSGGDVAGVSFSRDGGATWTSQDTGMPDQQHLKVASLLWTDATTVYALVGNGHNGGLMRGVVETNEANVVNGVWIHWTELSGVPTGLLGNGGDPDAGTGLPGDSQLPKLKVQFAAESTGLDNPKVSEHPRSVGRLLVVDTSRDRLYVGTYSGGVYRAVLSAITSNPQWTRLGLNGEYVRSIDVDASQNALFASTYRGPIGSSASSHGKVWRIANASTASQDSATELTGSPINVEELRLLNGTLYGVMDARDGPTTYTEFGKTWIEPSVDAGYQRGLFRFPNAATAAASTTWNDSIHQITHTVNVGGTQVTRPDVSTGPDPCNTNTQKDQIWYSLDGYASGSNVSLWVGARNPACEVSGGQRIALTRLSTTDSWTTVASSDADPQSAPTTTILGTTNRQWWLAPNHPAYMLGGGTFTSSDVAVAPGATNTIYVAGRSGVWKSSDGGATWAPAVRSMSVTINRQLLNDPTNANNVDIGNVDFQYFTSTDRLQTVTQQDITSTPKTADGFAVTRDPVTNALIVGLGQRDDDAGGEVWWKNPSSGSWQLIRLPSGVTQRPIGLLAIKDASGARSVLAAVDEMGVYQSKFNTSTSSYDDFTQLTTAPAMFQDSGLKRASFVQGVAGSNNVYLYDKTQGVFRGHWTYGGGNWSWTWAQILDYPSVGSNTSPAAGDGSGYVAPHPTNADVLYVTTGGDPNRQTDCPGKQAGEPHCPPAVLRINNATTATVSTVSLDRLAAGVITDPGPLDVDPDGVADSDSWASIVIAEPATSSHPVRLWSVNPNSALDPAKWNLRELDGLTAQPLIPLDLDYDPRDGNVYIATFGIGVYTAYLPTPGPA